MKPKVSVLMAAYNVEPFIPEAVEAILAQRGIPFELLIGDDASSDGTWSRIRRYTMDPRVRAWRFRVRRGSSSVWNRLIRRAQGTYLSICDADDRILPGNLQTLSRVLDRAPGVGVVCAGWEYMDVRGRRLRRWRRVPPVNKTWDLIRREWTHGGSMFRRKVIQQVGGYRERLLHADAPDLFLRLSEVTQFSTLPGRAYYRYRLHPYPAGLKAWRRRLIAIAIREAIGRRYGYTVSW